MDQAGIKISGKNINNLRYTDPNGKGQRGTKKPLDEGERGEWKTWLNNQHLKNKDHGIWSHHSMANRREKMGWQTIFLGCKITADGDCSHEIKRHLLLEMKPHMAQMVKNLLAKQETWVQSLGWEDPLDMGWQLTPVFLPREFHRQRSLVGYSPRGCKESDMTEQLTLLLSGLKWGGSRGLKFQKLSCQQHERTRSKKRGLIFSPQ